MVFQLWRVSQQAALHFRQVSAFWWWQVRPQICLEQRSDVHDMFGLKWYHEITVNSYIEVFDWPMWPHSRFLVHLCQVWKAICLCTALANLWCLPSRWFLRRIDLLWSNGYQWIYQWMPYDLGLNDNKSLPAQYSAPWCWNMNPNMFPNKIIQSCS